MKLLVLALILTSCWGQQGSPPREVTWDYSEWQPIIAPCPTCRQSRILQAKPAIVSPISIRKNPVPREEDHSSVVQLHPVIQQTNIPLKSTKPIPPKAPLVPSQPPRTLPITFPPSRQSNLPTTPVVNSVNGGQVRLVYLPEGSIQQLNSANAARIIPTSQAPVRLSQGAKTIPPLNLPQEIQSIEFSDKQKRDHEGRIVSGGSSNNLPMSLITSRGHENDAREKLKLLEAALSSPIEQEEGKLPRVFIAPSHVPPPPGYVKIPLVPQGKPEAQENKDESLPPTFLTPDSRNPPPGFVKFDLPSAVSQLSKDIPVVVPNSQVEPNVIFNRPSFSPTPGPVRPDASLNFQAQNVRTGKNIEDKLPPVQVISKGESKPNVPPKSVVQLREVESKPSPQPAFVNSLRPALRPLPQRPTPSIPQNNFQTQFFPPRQPSPLPQQFLPNPNQPRPFAPRPGQPPFVVFPGQPVIQAGQFLPQQNQPIPQPGQQNVRPGQSFSQTGIQPLRQNPVTQRPNQQFIQQNQPFQRPSQEAQRPLPQLGQPVQFNQHFPKSTHGFPQQGQPFLQPGQSFPRIIQHFQQPNQAIPQPDQRLPPKNPNNSIFQSPDATIKSDFPEITTPFSFQPQNPDLQTTLRTIHATTPASPPPQSSPFSPRLPTVSTQRPIPNSVVQFSPRPQQVTSFTSKQFPSSSPTPFAQFSPSPVSVTQRPRFPPRPTSFSTPAPVSPITQSSPSSFSPTSPDPVTPSPFTQSPFTPRPFTQSSFTPSPFTPRPFTSSPFTPRPASLSPITQTTERPTVTPSQRPLFSTTQKPFTSSHPVPSSTPRPQLVTFTPRTPVTFNSPRSPFQQTFGFDDTSLETSTLSFQDFEGHNSFETLEPEIPSFQEPEIPSFQEPQPPRIPTFQENGRPPVPSTVGPLTVRIPSFQRPQTATFTRFPNIQSPRIPSFQRPSTQNIPEEEEPQESQEPGRRQRLPIFPRFQRPRVTTIAPEEEEQTLHPEFTTAELSTAAPTTPQPTTPSPPKTTTVKVTTFKPKFNFSPGNRRPFIRRKPRPTEEGKKDAGEKKSESVTLFPPFSVARTLNPLRTEKESDDTRLPGQAGVTLPPAGAFGRRLRPRTKTPAVRSDEDSGETSPRPSGSRSIGLVGNRARDLPNWLKARRRIRGRFRGSTTTTTEDARVVDSILEEDVPLDVLENNGFSGAESTLVVFSRPPENAVVDPINIQEDEKVTEEEVEIDVLRQEEQSKEVTDTGYASEVTHIDTSHQIESIAGLEENPTHSESSEVQAEQQDPVDSDEDYTYEQTEVLPEPEPEPNTYVAEYNEYEDDTEDTSETYNTHDQPHRQPPSFPNPQPPQHANIRTSAHSHPPIKFPVFPSVVKSKTNPVEKEVDYIVDEVDDATERYVRNESSDESELVVILPLDEETYEQKHNDTETDIKSEFDSVTKKANYSYENNSSEIIYETFELGGEGEEGADGDLDGESQEHREDSYEEYNSESPEILSIFPNDYFTALSPGELQDYDYYEYDSYVDEDYTEEGVDQNFGGSSAQVVYAVPVTEYEPEETTLGPVYSQYKEEEEEEENITDNRYSDSITPTTEENIPTTTEGFWLGEDEEYATTEMPLTEITDPFTEYLLELDEDTPEYGLTTQIPEKEEIPLPTLLESLALTTTTTDAPVTTVPDATSTATTTTTTSTPATTSTTTTTPATTTTTTTTPATTPTTTTTTASTSTTTTTTTTTPKPKPRPASIRPLYARLQSIGKKAAEIKDKKLARVPRILGQSTVTEIRSSEPIICFQDNQCVRARGGQRRRRSYRP